MRIACYCATVFAGTTGEGSMLLRDCFLFSTGEGSMLLRDSFAYATGKGDVLLHACFAYTTGEGNAIYCCGIPLWKVLHVARYCL